MSGDTRALDECEVETLMTPVHTAVAQMRVGSSRNWSVLRGRP